MKYLMDTMTMWDKRERLLIRIWGSTDDENRQRRAARVGNVLASWKRYGLDIYYRLKDEDELKKREMAGTMVVLECSNFRCKYNPERRVTAMRYENYDDSKVYPCNICGQPMDIPGIDKAIYDLLNR